MAICKSCGVEQAGFMSDLCGKCIEAPPKPVTPAQAQATEASAGDGALTTEGDYAALIGQAIIWLSIVGAAICIFLFGQYELPDGPYSTKKVWNTTLIGFYVASGLNGVFFGFLLSKIGSVLKHLERLKESR